MQNILRSRGCADPSRGCNGGCARSRRVHRPLAVLWGAALPYRQPCRRTGSSTSQVLLFTVTWLVDDAAAQSCWRCIRGLLGEARELTQSSSFRRASRRGGKRTTAFPLGRRLPRPGKKNGCCEDFRPSPIARLTSEGAPTGSEGSLQYRLLPSKWRHYISHGLRCSDITCVTLMRDRWKGERHVQALLRSRHVCARDAHCA